MGRGVQVMYFHNGIKSGGSSGSSLHKATQTAARGANPHPHSSPVLEMDPQGRAVTLMQIHRAYRGRAHARLTKTSAVAADAVLLNATPNFRSWQIGFFLKSTLAFLRTGCVRDKRQENTRCSDAKRANRKLVTPDAT